MRVPQCHSAGRQQRSEDALLQEAARPQEATYRLGMDALAITEMEQ